MARRHARIWGGAALLLASSLALIAVPGWPATAEAASCGALQAKLSGLGTARPDSAKAARFARAIAKQRKELDRTRSMAARAGCRGSGGSARCRKITSTQRKMETRLAELDGQRRKALGGSGSSATRRTIQSQMRRQGCGASAKPKVSLARVAPVERKKRPPVVATSMARPNAPVPSAPTQGGSYRTVCVRTCDGYYFPINHATTSDRFRADAAQCAAMCPAAETKLFVHGQSGGAESMVDRVGRPYRAMPYAFRHTQQSYRPNDSCSCGRPVTRAGVNADLRGTASSPVQLPDGLYRTPGDGETVRNAAVGFGWDKAQRLVAQGTREASDRPVRVVGPRFLPDR